MASACFCFLRSLSWNLIGSEGAAALAPALTANGGLTMLLLARNDLGEEGTKAICEALEQNKTLKELDISGDSEGESNIGWTCLLYTSPSPRDS